MGGAGGPASEGLGGRRCRNLASAGGGGVLLCVSGATLGSQLISCSLSTCWESGTGGSKRNQTPSAPSPSRGRQRGPQVSVPRDPASWLPLPCPHTHLGLLQSKREPLQDSRRAPIKRWVLSLVLLPRPLEAHKCRRRGSGEERAG